MKLTNADLIRNREQALLENISDDLDRDSIRKLLEAKYHLALDGDSLVCRDGDLVVHDNQVAYKVQFQAMVSLSLLFNRQGECLEADLFTGEQVPETPDNSASAAVSGTGQVATESMDGVAFEDASAGQHPGQDSPKRIADTYADTGRGADVGAPDDGVDDTVAKAAAPGAEPAGAVAETSLKAGLSVDEHISETPAEEAPDAGEDAPPSARMASSIAEMISEINKT